MKLFFWNFFSLCFARPLETRILNDVHGFSYFMRDPSNISNAAREYKIGSEYAMKRIYRFTFQCPNNRRDHTIRFLLMEDFPPLGWY